MGCIGAMCNMPCFLLSNAIFLGILIGAEVAVMYIYSSYDFQISSDNVQKLWMKELKEPGAMSALEQHIKCCGLHSPQDYVDHNMTIPQSCYEDYYSINPQKLFIKGCWERIAEESLHVGSELKSTFGIVCSIELIASMFACFLAIKTSRSSYQRIP
ncbi:protein late bloomer-like isoform X2 [Teleopsis dalmanni]|nr:protein late bloomer-like isoform X2 [Teleopsis dalmanni]